MPPCDVCAQGKIDWAATRSRIALTQEGIGVNIVIHTDTMHHRAPSPREDTHVQVSVDRCKRFAWVELFRAKTCVVLTVELTRAEARPRARCAHSEE